MFYKCSKCGKNWQYPIGKCPDCFCSLERRPSRKVKVIGASQSKVPTIMHPETPYFVLVLEDQNGNRWVQKTTKEHKIGDYFSVEPVKNKDGVAIWRVKYDPLEAIEKIIELIGGIKIDPQDEIIILPTLIAPKHPYFASNTSPEFLDALLQYLKKQGACPEKIKVVAQSFDQIPIEASVQKSKILDVCLSHQINLLDLSKGKFIEKNGYQISEEAFRSDLIINLPILKLDRRAGIKGASENSLVFLKKESYLSLKEDNSASEKIPEIVQKILPNHLTIADCQNIQKSNGFTVFAGLALAGFNPLNLDRIFAEICLEKNLPKYLEKIRIEDIDVAGRTVEELRYDLSHF